MSVRVQHRRGSIAAHASFVGAEGELTWATDEKRWIGHDGATPGGVPVARKDEVTAEALRQIGNANFTFQVTDRLVTPNAAFTAARAGTLPLASAVAAGRGIIFFDALPAINGSNTLTVARSGSDTINGATSYPCSTPRGRWEFVSDGVSKWSVEVVSAANLANTPAGSIAATTVQAAINELDSEKQPLDAELTAIAGLTSAADRVPYFTGAGAAALATLTSAGRALIDDPDAAAQRTTLGAAPALTVISATGGATGDLPITTPNDRLTINFTKGPGSFGFFVADVEVARTATGSNYAYIALILRNLTDGTVIAQTAELTIPLEYNLLNQGSRSIAVNSLVPGKTYQISILGRANASSVVNSSQMYISGVHG